MTAYMQRTSVLKAIEFRWNPSINSERSQRRALLDDTLFTVLDFSIAVVE